MAGELESVRPACSLSAVTDAPPPARRPSALWLALAVGVFALVLRLAFVATMVEQTRGTSWDRIGGDSKQYLDLARNFVELGRFVDDAPGRRNFGTTYYSLLRPPGYPLLCAVFERSDARVGVLWTQAVIGSLLPAIVTWLGATMLSRTAGVATGVLAAISPCGIGLTGLILADLPFSVAFAFGVALLWAGCRGSRAALVLSGLTFGVATLIKPIGLYWVLVVPFVAIGLSRAAERKLAWRPLVAGLLINVAMILAWSARNYHVGGVFTLSTVDAQNLRYYLAPAAQEWARTEDAPVRKKLKKSRYEVIRRDEQDILTMPARAIYKRQWAESLDIFRDEPAATLQAFGTNLFNNLTGRFSHFEQELPAGGVIRRSLLALESIRASMVFGVVAVALMLVALIVPPIVRRDPTWRSRAWVAWTMAIVASYLIVFTGTTSSTGSRIVYPAQFALLMLLAAGATSIVRDGRSLHSSNRRELL